MTNVPRLGTGGDTYIPYEERAGAESVMFFARDPLCQGLHLPGEGGSRDDPMSTA